MSGSKGNGKKKGLVKSSNNTEKWRPTGIIVSLLNEAWVDDEFRANWKEPFKALKLSDIRAEDDHRIYVRVDPSELEDVYKLTDGRFLVETILETSIDHEHNGN